MDDPSAKRRRRLRDLNTDDMLRAAGLMAASRRLPALRRLFDGPASLLARWLDEFDQAVAAEGAGSAARALLRRLGQGVEPWGAEIVTEGPRLFVSNHPGLGDVLALLTRLDQPDLRIVARERDFLRALPSLAQQLLVVPQTNAARVLRDIERHLSAGGAVLTFPAGRIEPDPAWFDPSPSWARWSTSTELLARRVPGLKVQPLLVAGVRARAFVDPWAARWRRRPEDREWTAAVLQLAYQVLGRGERTLAPIRVASGEPLETVSTATLIRALAALRP
jgi:hypothetical protein